MTSEPRATAAAAAGGVAPAQRPEPPAGPRVGDRWSRRREVLAAQARERTRVLAELAALLHRNPFLETASPCLETEQ